MNRATASAATLFYAIGVAVPQVVALAWLPTSQFGQFSLLYLVYALAGSFLLSTVNETWSRAGMGAEPAEYLRAGSFISAFFAATTIVVGLLIGVDIWSAICGGIGVYSAAAWSSARYLHAASGAWGLLAASEMWGLGISVAALVASVAIGMEPLSAVLLSWALYGLSALIASSSISIPSLRTTVRWLSRHKREVADLLPESLLLDVGSVATPALLFPFLGAASFGRYRAISNIAFPVRLALAAIRPTVARMSISQVQNPAIQALIVVAATLLGAVAGVGVLLLSLRFPSLGVIADLGGYWIQVAIFVAVTSYSSLAYMFCRIWARRRILLLGRVSQTAIMVGAPILGLVLAHEQGAINGYVAGATITCGIWAVALGAIREAPRP